MKIAILALLMLAACQNIKNPSPTNDSTINAKGPVMNIVEITYLDGQDKDTVTMMGKPYLNDFGILYLIRYKDTIGVAGNVKSFINLPTK